MKRLGKCLSVGVCMFFGAAVAAGCSSKVRPAAVRTPEPVYNFTYSQLGGDVMPVGGFIGPPGGFSHNGHYYESRITDEQYRLVKESGVNVIYGWKEDYNTKRQNTEDALKWAEKNDVVYVMRDTYLFDLKNGKNVIEDDAFAARLKEYTSYQSFGGLIAADEPSKLYFEGINEVNQAFRRAYGGKAVTYLNLHPINAPVSALSGGSGNYSYGQYLEDYFQTIEDIGYLSYDFYPMRGTGAAQFDIHQLYFKNLTAIRAAAQKNDVPFWTFVQNGGLWEGDPNVRVPNEGEIRYQVNMSLAFGAKGVQYFTYYQPPEWPDMPSRNCGFMNKDGTKNAMYFYAQNANRQIAAADQVLMNSANLGVIQHGKSLAPISDPEVRLTNFRELKSISGADAVVGCFDNMGRTALYVVNNSITEDKAQVSLELDGAYAIDVIQRGEKTEFETDRVTLTFAQGEGALIVLK